MKLYHELAEYYYSIEKENRDIDNDVHMILTFLEKIKNPSLLDIGCGTGEHLDKLSKMNIDCTGIDSSNSMLRIAKLRFPDSIKFINEDMRTFNYTEKFNIIISLFGSFDYLIEDSDINKVLKNTWIALKNNGIGVFELWNAIPVEEIKDKPLTLVSKTNYNNKVIIRERGFKLLDYQNKTVVEVNYNYSISENGIIKDKHLMRAFTCDEISHFLENNGFQVIAFYANSMLEPYKDTSNKIIAFFKKQSAMH